MSALRQSGVIHVATHISREPLKSMWVKLHLLEWLCSLYVFVSLFLSLLLCNLHLQRNQVGCLMKSVIIKCSFLSCNNCGFLKDSLNPSLSFMTNRFSWFLWSEKRERERIKHLDLVRFAFTQAFLKQNHKKTYHKNSLYGAFL